MNRRPRAADVARRAGVSLTAVSFVMKGDDSGNIAPATRARILAAASDLGYLPDRVAQSRHRQRTHAIGLITDSIATSPLGGRRVAGAIERATTDDYVILLFDSHHHRERERAAADEFASRQFDGLIYATAELQELDGVPETPLPAVLANCRLDGDPRWTVVPDDRQGGRVATDHLLELGHRRIVMLSGAAPGPGRPGSISGPIRAKGFRAAARKAGLTAAEAPLATVGWDIQGGYRGAMRVLTGPRGTLLPDTDRPTGILAVTDRSATGVLLAAARLGLEVPRDLSVVGFGDMDTVAGEIVPALTTVALPDAGMGERSVELLIDDVAGRLTGPPLREHLECRLVLRDSTGPPP